MITHIKDNVNRRNQLIFWVFIMKAICANVNSNSLHVTVLFMLYTLFCATVLFSFLPQFCSLHPCLLPFLFSLFYSPLPVLFAVSVLLTLTVLLFYFRSLRCFLHHSLSLSCICPVLSPVSILFYLGLSALFPVFILFP